MKPTGRRVEYYTDTANEWRWTQYAANGEVVATAHEGFVDKRNARDNWLLGWRGARHIFNDGCEYIRSTDAITAVIHTDELPDGRGEE